MQGPAVAYDLARFAQPSKILLADICLETAIQKAQQVHRLIGQELIQPMQVDATDEAQVRRFFEEAEVIISAVPWQLNRRLAELALECNRSFCDMGNDPDWFWFEFRKRNEEAQRAGITIVPDTGLAPGMVNHLGLYCMEKMDRCEEIRLRCGGLPQRPLPPLGYKLVFNFIGVITEYSGEALILRDGKLQSVPTLEEVETLEIQPLGLLEAAPTSGGTSTAPYTLEGKVCHYDYKTLRYPGHWAIIRALRDLGFFQTEPVRVGETSVVPREVTSALISSRIRFPEEKDLVVVYAYGRGTKNGAPYEITLQILDYHDERTGFTAMERMTGFSTAIIAAAIAAGRIPHGLIPYEQTMSGHEYLREFLKRGFQVREKIVHQLQEVQP